MRLFLGRRSGDFYPDARWQRFTVHWYRNVFSDVPSTKVREVSLMLKAIHAQEDLAAAQTKADEVVAKHRVMRLNKVANWVADTVNETLGYYDLGRYGEQGGV